MSLDAVTVSFDEAAAELVAVAAELGVGPADVAGLVSEPSAAFAAERVLAHQALSHNAATVTALTAATRELRSRIA